MTANFDDTAIAEVLDKIVSYALASGRFDSVNGHEPKSAPSNEVTCAVWSQSITPLRSSGLAMTSIMVVFQVRVYMPFTANPFDSIDPKVMSAATDLMGAFSADFDFGGTADVRNVDLLGANGTSLSAMSGYVEIDRRVYRVMTVSVPIVINDAFSQVA